MTEGGGDEVGVRDVADAVLASAGPARSPRHVVEARFDGLVVAVPHHLAEVGIAETEEQGHGLRCPEAQVVAGGAAVLRCQLPAGGRVLARYDGAQGAGVHGAFEAEVGSTGTQPHAGRFAVSQVVLLGAAGDRAEHVLGVGDLADAQHDRHRVASARTRSRDADASEDANSCVAVAGEETDRSAAGGALIGTGEVGFMAGVLGGRRGG